MMRWVLGAGLGLVGLAAPAVAKDAAPCPAGAVCASVPATVAAQVMKAGYRALLTTDRGGDPEVQSTAEGYDWQVYFYDCENHAQCAALQFSIGFKPDPIHTAARANKWNATQRFGQMAVTDDGGLTVSHDLSTVGGVNPVNFADQISWWTSVIAQIEKFFAAERAGPASPAPARGAVSGKPIASR